MDKYWSLYQAEVVSKCQLQSVIGSLMLVHKAVKPTSFFVKILLHSLREAKHKIHVSDEMRKDLAWFLEFLPAFNGTATYDHKVIPHQHTLAVDACLEGMGEYRTTRCMLLIFQRTYKTIKI